MAVVEHLLDQHVMDPVSSSEREEVGGGGGGVGGGGWRRTGEGCFCSVHREIIGCLL